MKTTEKKRFFYSSIFLFSKENVWIKLTKDNKNMFLNKYDFLKLLF